MSGIAGLIFRDPSRPVPGSAVRMLSSGFPGGEHLARIDGPGSLLVAQGEACLERVGDSHVVTEFDVSGSGDPGGPDSPSSPGVVIRRCYEESGTRYPAHLRGPLSSALWLPGSRRLLLASDRFGFRRLYYAATPTGIAFSSRVRGPLALPGADSNVEPDAIYAYLNFNAIPAPQTPYRGVRRLPPGHVLIWDDGRITVEAYWDMVYEERERPFEVATRELRHHTKEAVRRALLGTESKHTGAFLSGGTDSSTVVGFMSRLSEEPVHVFSIGFGEERYNELHYAELAARHFGSIHHTRVVTAEEAFGCVGDLVRAYDEPFGNDSSIPTYLCARLAREAGVRLLLAGDGGDEIFGGNERYRRDQILARYGLIPEPLRRLVIQPILRHLPAGGLSPLGKAQRYVERASLPNPDRFYTSEFFVAQERSRLLHPDFLAAVRGEWPWEVARSHYRRAGSSSELNRLLYLDLKVTLGDNDLFKVTRTAELAGVGVRFPLLDQTLVELMGTLPAREKVRGTEKRYLFKRAFQTLLPPEILAKVKHGFGLPISDWLKTHAGFRELARDTLLSVRCRERGYFAPGTLENLFRLHAQDRTAYYGGVLWTLLMLELWHRAHRDAE